MDQKGKRGETREGRAKVSAQQHLSRSVFLLAAGEGSEA